jgi:DNA-binding beta-propeller fold protein YncE
MVGDTLIGTIQVGNNVFDVAFNPKNQQIITSDSGQGTVSVIQTTQ